MNICFFNTTKAWGGGEKWHLDAALAFKKAGHNVTIVTNKKSQLQKRAFDNQIKVKDFSISNLSFLNPLKIFSVYRYLCKQKFDVIILNLPKDLKIAAPAAKWAGIQHVVYRRGSAIPVKNSFLNRWLFKNYLTDVIANSQATKQCILEHNKNLFPVDKIIVFYNGINIQHFSNLKQIEHEVPVIGNLGRCVYQKGQDILLQVASVLKNRRVDCHFVIGGDGALLEDLKKQAQTLEISDRVTFLGFVEDVAAFMQSIDIFALPSRWEGFGYVMAEAMASSKPVVAFDVSSNPEIVANNRTGLLVPYNNVEAFANAIEKLINQPTLCKDFGEKGLNRAKDLFDSEKSMEKVIRFFETNKM